MIACSQDQPPLPKANFRFGPRQLDRIGDAPNSMTSPSATATPVPLDHQPHADLPASADQHIVGLSSPYSRHAGTTGRDHRALWSAPFAIHVIAFSAADKDDIGVGAA